jgi:2-oxo-4-hydroxy-4-carboxy-5-ureidoimidazoline decarboxylase
MNLDSLNQLPTDAFVQCLGGIFEHSPWVAAGVAAQRPFASVEALHLQMCEVVRHAGIEAQLGLIRAHPELAGKAAIAGKLTADSAREQSGAGLDQCTAEEYAELTTLNAAYHRKCGFPFILAVRGHNRSSIIANLRERIARPTAIELAECLAQIERIAGFRLADALAS